MKVRVQFFSHLKDMAGCSEVEVDLPNGATMGDLLELLYTRTPELQKWDGRILLGAGLEFVQRDYVLQPNEDVAIMPPVQGG